MEQQLGSFGKADESFSKGIATASASAALPQTAFGLDVSVSVAANLDAKVLVEYLAAKIGGPVPKEVADFIVMALAVT